MAGNITTKNRPAPMIRPMPIPKNTSSMTAGHTDDDRSVTLLGCMGPVTFLAKQAATTLAVRTLVLTILLLGGSIASADFAEVFEHNSILPIVQETPGAAIVIVVDGKVVLQKTYGYRRQVDREPITPDTLFRLASVSKTFASAVATLLVEDRSIDWHTPIRTRLNHLEFKDDDLGNAITLHHLMSQSTGLMPHAYTNLVEDNMSYQRILGKLDRVDFVCAPGECYGYQNVVFSLVGDLVQETQKTDYASFVEQRLFVPLKMRRASIGLDAFVNDTDAADPHVWNGKDWVSVRTTPHYYHIAPAAGVNASISDMREWLLAQLGHKPAVLRPELLDQMQAGVIPTTRHQAHYRYRKELGNVHYGLGWRVFDYADQPGYVHHGGYVKGMRSEMVFNRQLQTGMVFLTNSEPADLNELIFEFVELHRTLAPSLGVTSVGR